LKSLADVRKEKAAVTNAAEPHQIPARHVVSENEGHKGKKKKNILFEVGRAWRLGERNIRCEVCVRRTILMSGETCQP